MLRLKKNGKHKLYCFFFTRQKTDLKIFLILTTISSSLYYATKNKTHSLVLKVHSNKY